MCYLAFLPAIKLQRISSWVHLSRIKPPLPESSEAQPKGNSAYSCEPTEDLKCIFKWLKQE